MPSEAAFDLTWGDVYINDVDAPTVVKVNLKRSKTDQMGKGVDVFIGATGSDIFLVAEIVQYVKLRGPLPHRILIV